jgi:hypothetical protein
MLRIILSIILGFIIPVGWILGVAVAVATFEKRLPDSLIHPWIEMFIYGSSVPGLILAPVGIPEYIFIFAKEKSFLPPEFFSDYTEAGFFILFNWSLYGAATYYLWGKLKKFRKHPASGITTPPEPPNFEKE